MKPTALLTVAACVLTGVGAPAATAAPGVTRRPVLVVAPHGSDSASGTAGAPLKSIQRAVDRLRAGGIVLLRGGVYHQRVSLHGVRHLTIRPYRHEKPVLSGGGLTAPEGRSALVDIAPSRDVTVRGLGITG